ncbi:Peptidase S28 [Arabidopsis suecica]|uniref:Peptidase S28 n=1 Tax=Arabidopsis suecica TaxID=45249 RepID=A0A8T1ZAR7_ARASU|nr:Peptidase S28 [Arabidopsis suecica]
MSLPHTILLLLIFSTSSSYFISFAHSKIARLGISSKTLKNASDGSTQNVDESDLKMYYFNQTLDHFTFTPKSYMTFQQRYAIDSTHWGGAKANAPILAFLGEESSLDSDLAGIGFLHDNGPRLKALLVYIEHRYYGKTMPFGSAEEALKNASTLGYLNAAQALADYAAILLHVKEKYSTKHSPIIVIGGSYGGMLAAWFRLKYPHIALGALASSAPLLYFEDTRPKFGYYYIVTKVFKETSERCYNTIRKSWKEIDRVAAKPNGLSILSKTFKTCAPLNGSFDIKDFLDTIYAEAVQYNRGPSYWVANVCNAINANTPNRKNNLLDRIFAGVVALIGNRTCYDTNMFSQPTNNHIAWRWQSCSEIVIPVGYDKQDTMFPTAPFNMTSYIDGCESYYGVPPRPHWITTYFGIQDVKLILRKFGSNIIFSNGLSDPYSVGGVLEDISDTVVAITTNGSHCQDISLKNKEDPQWLVMQREKEIKVIDSWISTYQNDLRDLNMSI